MTTYAGSGNPGFTDGSGVLAQFNQPAGIAIIPDGTIYVTEWLNHTVRKIAPGAAVSTVAGTGLAGYKEGPGPIAQFRNPNGIVALPNGRIYIADSGNHVIRELAPDGTVRTVAGSGVAGFADGPGSNARFDSPGGLALALDGSLIVADTGNHRIRRILFNKRAPVVTISLAQSIGEETPVFQLQFHGEAVARLRVESSEDLQVWAFLREVPLDVSGQSQLFGLVGNVPRFFRATEP